jgi:hypothetical protein
MNLGEVRGKLSAFAKGVETMGPIEDPMKKITIPGGASFTPKELVDLDRILGYFPDHIECKAVMILQGCISRALYITGSPMGPAYDYTMDPEEPGPAGPAPTDEPLNVA